MRASAFDYPVYLVVRLLICLVQAMSLEAGARLASFLAWLFAEVLRVRARVVEENLTHSYPDLSPQQRKELALRMWGHLFLLVLEVAHAPRKIHQTNWREHVQLHGEALLVRRLLADRPTLITTAHFGNFEVAGYVLALLGFCTHTVARNLDNRYLHRYVNQFRGSTGQYLIPKNGGYEQIEQVLGQGGTMTFLADQYAGPKGCWVEFFGRPASAHKAIALLALEHQAPVVVSYASRTGRPLHFLLSTYAVADPQSHGAECASAKSLTQWYTSRLEEIIRTAPDQYWWLHRRWKDTRAPKSSHKAA